MQSYCLASSFSIEPANQQTVMITPRVRKEFQWMLQLSFVSLPLAWLWS